MPDKLARAAGARSATRPVIAAASTHPGEEAVIIEAHRRLRAQLSRAADDHRAAPSRARAGHRRDRDARPASTPSLRSRGELPDRGTDIYVADTIGELGLIYRLAPIVFMGGSLVRHGGQNPIEAAKLGAAILHGPHVWNFAEIYAALDAARGAELVHRRRQAGGAHRRLAERRRARASRSRDAALQTVDTLGGALDRTLAALDPYLMQFRSRAARTDNA